MKILIHICCANCAAYTVKMLREEKHNLSGFWFNSNIHPYEEHKLRLNSVKRLADLWSIDMLYHKYEITDFLGALNISTPDFHHSSEISSEFTPLEKKLNLNSLTGFIPNRPERCKSCYNLRLERTAQEASKSGFDAFSTTLLISPYQDFEQIVSIGSALAEKYNILFYLKDFRQYFREAMAYARELGVYRQKYCGCIFSREERLKKSKSETLNSL